MKKYTLLLSMILFGFYAKSQNQNLYVENDLVHWRYVYENGFGINDLMEKPKLEFFNENKGIIKKNSMNHKKVNDEITADFFVEEKDGRYRVTVNNIRFFSTTQIQIGGISSSITDYPVETSLLKKDNTIKPKVWGIDFSEILHNYFFELFNAKESKNDDW